MAYKVGELLTPATVGSMAEQDSSDVSITGGVLVNTGGLHINGVPLTLQNVNVAGATGNFTGNLIFCPDGDGGSPCLAVYDGSSYKRIVLGATIST
jgi:hypothetical protein